MKKVVVCLFLLLMVLTSCQYEEASGAEIEQNNVKLDEIFSEMQPIAYDLCTAWEIVEADDKNMTVEGISEILNLTTDELTEGIIYVYTALSGQAQETVAEVQRAYLKNQVNACLSLHRSELVWIVSCSYDQIGAFDPIEVSLDEAEVFITSMEKQDEKLNAKYGNCRELFRLCSQPSDNYETSISRIKEIAGF